MIKRTYKIGNFTAEIKSTAFFEDEEPYSLFMCDSETCDYSVNVDFSADLQDEIKGPAIVLCSHGSFTDFLYCAMIMGKQYPFFIVARMYFYHSKLAWLIRKLGCRA